MQDKGMTVSTVCNSDGKTHENGQVVGSRKISLFVPHSNRSNGVRVKLVGQVQRNLVG